jgi:hypothetical protein
MEVGRECHERFARSLIAASLRLLIALDSRSHDNIPPDPSWADSLIGGNNAKTPNGWISTLSTYDFDRRSQRDCGKDQKGNPKREARRATLAHRLSGSAVDIEVGHGCKGYE